MLTSSTGGLTPLIDKKILKDGLHIHKIDKFLPQFTSKMAAPLAFTNTHPCAERYGYSSPLTLLNTGQGYIVVDGYTIQYHPLTWSTADKTLLIKDIEKIFELLQRRLNCAAATSLGRWTGVSIAGTEPSLVDLAKRIGSHLGLLAEKPESHVSFAISF